MLVERIRAWSLQLVRYPARVDELPRDRPLYVRLAGAPRVPTPQQFQAERERLERQGPKKVD